MTRFLSYFELASFLEIQESPPLGAYLPPSTRPVPPPRRSYLRPHLLRRLLSEACSGPSTPSTIVFANLVLPRSRSSPLISRRKPSDDRRSKDEREATSSSPPMRMTPQTMFGKRNDELALLARSCPSFLSSFPIFPFSPFPIFPPSLFPPFQLAYIRLLFTL